MPSYFYHLTFELYPTANPTEREASSIRAAPSSLWSPPRDADIFDILPSHPPRDKGGAFASHKGKTQPHRTTTDEKATSSVIDCGSTRRFVPGDDHDQHLQGSAGLATENRRRERTKSRPPSLPSAAICPRTAVQDWRFGRVSIESIDPEESGRDTDMAGENSSNNPNAAAFAALELGPTLGGDGSSTRAECMSLPTKNTEVGWGVVHFYRGEEMPPPGLGEAAGGEDGLRVGEDGCTTLCIPAVPSFILPSEFLGFVGEKWRRDVTHFRMVMTSRMSRYLVLLKFRDGLKAKEWQKEFNGKVFNSMVAEICHVVFVKSITFANPTQPQDKSEQGPRHTAMASYGLKPFAPPTPNLIELPTCPVCLERMDDTNGLMTIPCQHVFHCRCLQSWKGSGCPVCRYTGTSQKESAGGDKRPFGSSVSNLCAVCDCTDDLWICLICGNVGCGRYKGGHAKEHWKETAHCFSLEIETQHVWDYAGDTWVHRLIRAKGDSQVVELPSHNNSGGGSSQEEDDLVPRSKVETMALEYTHMFTSQLESQRVYFEEKVAQAADKAHEAALAAEKANAAAAAADQRAEAAEAKCEELKGEIKQLERDLARERTRATRATDLARSLGKELQEEKQMSKGLAEKVAHQREAEEKRGELLKEIEELKETNRDLTMFISGQSQLRELEKAGAVAQEDLEGGTASAGPSRRRRKK
ncbi:related to cytoplasmic Zn-finger protein BRAP2 (BRCA1 associated protein) [Cephalotrichum gorgonifer]|uniref:Related to cytoplasmic Zn-finger protein BRAP2 (BRCA1 associated protein) n=1 Tax=Cephalotrichum gorgonifer TaxID=2041049 RepID=A0AAE8N3T3_9PEZI|nr:related to cytoplasmic Zn-finger protein BRAP2 (BRCA1 associated protein) [Cephalotrichum gorgonifer]